MTLIVGNGTAFTSTAEANNMYEMVLQNEQWLKDGRVIQDCIFGNILMPACKCRVSDVGTAEPLNYTKGSLSIHLEIYKNRQREIKRKRKAQAKTQ